MDINQNFPVVKIGQTVCFKKDGCNDGQPTRLKVYAVWYPKDGDDWSEEEEYKNLGYLGSIPHRKFPQLRAIALDGKMEGRNCVINGDDEKEFEILQ